MVGEVLSMPEIIRRMTVGVKVVSGWQQDAGEDDNKASTTSLVSFIMYQSLQLFSDLVQDQLKDFHWQVVNARLL